MEHRQDIQLEQFDELPSTNDSILAAGRRGAPEGTTHLALSQTQGRGRLGRSWWSPPGRGLYFSTLLRPRMPRERWSGLSLLAGAGAREALLATGATSVEVEWPNDLVVGHRKLGGILCEVASDAKSAWVALGIGVNLDLADGGRLPEDPDRPVICLSAAGAAIEELVPAALAHRILLSFWRNYERFQDGSELVALVSPQWTSDGRAVRVELPSGESFAGSIAGLAASGELLVREREGRLRTVLTGDVHYV